MIYRSRTREKYNLEQVPFAQGGEGKIYNVIGTPNVVAKINKPGIISTKKTKVNCYGK